MSDFDNTNSGALFKNDKQNDKQPDYRGSLNVGGVEYWVSSWVKTSKKGDKYMSLSVQQKQSGRTQQARQETPPSSGSPAGSDSFDDDLPF